MADLQTPEFLDSKKIFSGRVFDVTVDTIREGDQTYDRVNEIPEQLRKRTLAVRSFDSKGMMVDNRLVGGKQIEPVIEELLAPPNVDYLHIHFAAAGCYAARVERGPNHTGARLTI